ncbi:uncharacterized protein LOC128228602 [Mya arenaria]|uniref:uncharacterized protein LOC128228602 n=1 Tax=Mya arenaria TaxID=6604 RepID=UPI0022E84736|nr:uncharacterized protein LOC128228602 [Mya arenaria]
MAQPTITRASNRSQFSLRQFENDVLNLASTVHEFRNKLKKLYKNISAKDVQLFVEYCTDAIDSFEHYRRPYIPEEPVRPNTDKTSQTIIERLERQNQKLDSELSEAIQAKDRALNRLGELQTRVLQQDTTEIPFLSDENRPTNLGMKFKELFEDEWTNAFSILTASKGLKDDEGIEILLKLLKDSNFLCKEASANMRSSIERIVTHPTYLTQTTRGTEATDDESGPTLSAPAWSRGGGDPKVGQSHVSREAVKQNLAGDLSTKAVDQKQQLHLQQQQEQKKQKQQEHDGHDGMRKGAGIRSTLENPIRDFCKYSADEVLKNVDLESIVWKIIRDLKFQKALLNHKDITNFVVQCLRLCWLMQAQYPPMVLDFSFRSGDVFNTDALAAYSTRGPTIAYMVWPPLRLHMDGPLVCKGYAEGLKK